MRRRRVLVVDDDDSIREIVQLSLELVGGWNVSTASNGTEGWMVARTEQPDAVLLDMMMPGMDGPTTFKQLQGDPQTRDIPVILLTAKVGFSQDLEPVDPALAGLIVKPFDPMALPKQIAMMLGWQE